MRLLIILSLGLLTSCTSKPESRISNPVFINYAVRASFPHDREAFIEGLVIHNGELYESTGQENSWIGLVDIKTGKVDKKITLDKKYFGEGITILNNKIYQLTWQNKTGFVYDLNSYQLIREFNYSTEGWGLTHNNESLVMSDGTSNLYFLDTLNLKIIKKIEVTYEGKPVTALNELEFIDGYIYANVWQTQWIAKIDLQSGMVKGFLDLAPLIRQARLLNPKADVLNGIAWHETTQLMLVTGKNWPNIYALKLQEPL